MRVFRALLTLGIVVCFAHGLEAATLYVDATCGNVNTYNPSTRNCATGSDVVKTTIGTAQSAMASGDIMYIRGGTPSNPTFYGGFGSTIPSGTGASGRTVVSAYPITRTCSGHNPADVLTCVGSTYETVVLRPGSSGGTPITINGSGPVPGPIRNRLWITIEGLIVDAAGGGDNGITMTSGGSKSTNFPDCNNFSKGDATAVQHIRLLNIEVKNAKNQGFLGDMWNKDIQIIGSYVHHNGSDFNTDHGIYIAGQNNWIVLNRIEHNKRYGIHFYSQPSGTPEAQLCDPYSENNLIERNRLVGNSTGIGILRGSINATVRNNLAYGNTPNSGIELSTGYAGINRVYNNTMVNNGGSGLTLGNADNSLVRNNIYDGYFQDVAASNVTNTNNYNINTTGVMPDFVDPAAGDFRLRAGDARINAGFNLTSEGVTIDFAGNARPAEGAFDIGAYEHNASGPAPQTFDFALTTDVDAETGLTLAQGANGVVEVTATRIAGTAAAVTFAATGLPSGTTMVFSPTSCTPTTTCTTNATIDVSNTTPQGSYTVTVRASTGTGGSALTRSAVFDLMVTCN